MIINVQLNGNVELASFFNGMLEAVAPRGAIYDIVAQNVSVGLDVARIQVPVATGFLRSSIFFESVVDEIIVGALAPYAGFVEFGTSKMAAQPFLIDNITNAVEWASESINRYLSTL